jgi:archaellum component FlaF (FlaF/FlaG flagellin family)
MNFKTKVLLVLCLFSFMLSVQAQEFNFAKYRVVTQSSSSDQNHCGHLVVDGSAKTYWESAVGKTSSIIIDLASQRKITKIKVLWGTNYGTKYKVYISESKLKGFEEVYSTSNGSGNIETIPLLADKTLLVKIEVLETKDHGQGCIIREVEVMGDCGSDARFIASQPQQLTSHKLSLNGNGWKIQNSLFIHDNPDQISKTGYDDSSWVPASVPGTVLSSYYNFGALPDPLYGDNMHQISDEFFSGNDFWYRTSVVFPPKITSKRLFLDFSGINWKSEIYFNGQYLGRIDGAFLRAEFEVTKPMIPKGINTIAVLVHHPDNWGTSNYKVTQKTIGSRTTNGDVLGLDSPTFLASAGWNWLPIVKGRNIGIWNDVTFRIAGDVSINNPWVSSNLSLPDTTKADLVIHTELKNQCAKAVSGVLVASFDKTVIKYSVSLKANEEKTISIDKTLFSQLSLNHPRLWWPNGYGSQNLSNLKLTFIEKGTISDTKTIKFGVRQIDYNVVDHILFLYCNGKRLLIRGGNWGLSEALLRCDSLGYDTRVKLHKDANFNMIRNWVGMTGHEAFYDACDRYGILIWDDFWLANPVDGPIPKDSHMFMDNVRDKIKWVRKHPSLALYCGRNEGLPPPELDSAMQHETMLLDGTRHYISQSAAGTVSGLGPYDVRDPKWYFANRGITFHSELGIIAIPEVESMRRMMPAKDLWPINNMWAIHDYQWGRSEKFTDTIEVRYGKPTSVDDYCRRAQLLNYESAKAMFESLQSNQGSGILLWMSQAAWPSLICQLYDYYFEYTSAFFAAKKACQPLCVFYDVLKNEVRVSNNTLKDLSGLTVKATVYDLSGKRTGEQTASVDIQSASVKSCFIPESFNNGQVNFLKLVLQSKGKIVADNFYWCEAANHSCIDLNMLSKVDLKVKTTTTLNKGTRQVIVTLKNEGTQVALLVKLKVKTTKTEESILPVFFSDNYVSLIPGESKTITLKFKVDLVKNDTAQLWIEGWNSDLKKINF